MKALVAFAFFLALIAVAGAKPAPVEESRPTLALNKADIDIGPTRRMAEREYFQAPQSQFNAGSFPCRLQPVVFDKTRLAQSCQ